MRRTTGEIQAQIYGLMEKRRIIYNDPDFKRLRMSDYVEGIDCQIKRLTIELKGGFMGEEKLGHFVPLAYVSNWLHGDTEEDLFK